MKFVAETAETSTERHPDVQALREENRWLENK